MREGKSPDASLQRVKIIQHVRGNKWKAEWINPNPGLVDYVESQNLVVRWKEQKAFFRDEEKARQLRADNERHGYDEKSPMANVLYQVFESLGENELNFYKGILSGPPDALSGSRIELASIVTRLLHILILIVIEWYTFPIPRLSNWQGILCC